MVRKVGTIGQWFRIINGEAPKRGRMSAWEASVRGIASSRHGIAKRYDAADLDRLGAWSDPSFEAHRDPRYAKWLRASSDGRGLVRADSALAFLEWVEQSILSGSDYAIDRPLTRPSQRATAKRRAQNLYKRLREAGTIKKRTKRRKPI